MPLSHRYFLKAVEKVANIRTFIHNNQEHTLLCAAYDDCLTALAHFRQKHIEMVARYVVVMASKSAVMGKGASGDLGGKVASPISVAGAMGTGGTKPIEFLKSVRDAVIRARHH